MTCKDCINIDVCNEHERLMLAVDNIYELMYQEGVEKSCKHFKNKADFVEVVKCKDCAHYIEMEGFDYNGRKTRICVWHSALRGENDYCSDAIRTSKRTPEERGGET